MSNDVICPGCNASVSEGEKCPHCNALHHEDCWDFHEGCALLGCGEKSSLPTSPKDLQMLEQDCRLGLKHARRLWSLLMIGSLCFLGAFFLLILSFASPTLGLAWITAPFEQFLLPLLLLLALLSVILFGIQGIWALIVQRDLEKRTSSSLQAPITLPANICERLELPSFEQKLVDLGDRLAGLSVLIAFLTLVFSTTFITGMKLPILPTIVVVALGLGMPWLALSLAREQSFFVLTLESRVNATFKKEEPKDEA